MHQIKYHRKKELAFELGKWYGEILRRACTFSEPELIIPVPLHPKRLHQRGFNQSAWFARGLSASLGIPTLPKAMRRLHHTSSQTSKSRLERFQNVEHAFQVQSTSVIQGKHILLVDDVLTTGATLEACAIKLLECPDTRLSMATLAIASMS